MMAQSSYRHTMRHRIARLVTLSILCVGVAFPTFDSAAGAAATQPDCDGSCQEQLAAARAATAQYHDESVALADGFDPEPICVQRRGVGGMGVHYENLARMQDTLVDVTSPEILLYEPEPDGTMRLVALEYFAPVMSNGQPWFGGRQEPPPVIDNPPPVLFGQTFEGPMPGHGPGMPWHYDLHVWAWRHNPSGMFTQFNPKVSCL